MRIILSALWAARMLSGLQGDAVRLIDPVFLNQTISGTTDVPVTSELILIMSAVMLIPILMSFLSLTLPQRANRLTNLIVGAFFVIWEIVFLAFVYIGSAPYEVFWGIAYLLFAVLVVWYAWQWPQKGSVEVIA